MKTAKEEPKKEAPKEEPKLEEVKEDGKETDEQEAKGDEGEVEELLDEKQKTAIDDMLENVGLKKKEEPPKEEPPKKEELEKKEEPPKKEEEPPKVEETELEIANRNLAEMRALLNEMARGVVPAAAPGTPAVPVPGAVPPAATPGAPQAPSAERISPLQAILGPEAVELFKKSLEKDEVFLSPEEIDSIIDKPELLQQAFNKVRRKAAAEVVDLLPSLVSDMVTRSMSAYKRSQDFYEANEDLSPYRDFVSSVYEKVYRANKDKSNDELLTLTAEEARKTLRLPAPVAKSGKPAGAQKPAFAGSKGAGGGRKLPSQKPTAEKTQQELMMDMLP